MNGLVLSAIERDADFETALTIRHRVFVVEQHVPEDLEHDDEDAHAYHVLARLVGQPVGTGRLLEKPGGQGKIGRMAVLPEARGHAVGRALVEALMARARARGLVEVFLDAQAQAIGFYEKLGFVGEGDRFMDAGIEHLRMRMKL